MWTFVPNIVLHWWNLCCAWKHCSGKRLPGEEWQGFINRSQNERENWENAICSLKAQPLPSVHDPHPAPGCNIPVILGSHSNLCLLPAFPEVLSCPTVAYTPAFTPLDMLKVTFTDTWLILASSRAPGSRHTADWWAVPNVCLAEEPTILKVPVGVSAG